MKTIILCAIVLGLISCKGDIEERSVQDNKSNIQKDLYQVALEYKPVHTNLSKDLTDSILDIDLAMSLKDTLIQERNESAVSIILLKLYLFHLQHAHQGYDLYSMRSGKSGLLINYFLLTNNLPAEGEFMHSGVAFDIVSKDSVLLKNQIISGLVDSIANERENIEKKVESHTL